MRRRKGQAFTLVELLVVVSIIALLIAILLPSLKKAREQAKAVQCLSNLRSMGLGIQYYTQDHNGMLPGPLHPPIYRLTADNSDPNSPFSPLGANDRNWFLLARLGPYFSRSDQRLALADELATCPTQLQKAPDKRFIPDLSHKNDFGVVGSNPAWSKPFHYLPNSWPNTAPVYYFGWTNTGYSWPGWVNSLEDDEEEFKTNRQRGITNSQHRPKPIDRIKRAADEWAIGEAWYNATLSAFTPGNPPSYNPVGTWQILTDSNPWSTGGGSHHPLRKQPPHREGKGTQLLFFDSHAATFVGVDKDWANAFPANRNPNPKPW